MCCISMDASNQCVIYINGFEIFSEKWRGVNIDKIAMCLSMDSSKRALSSLFVFELLAENRKYSNEYRGVNIDD